MPANGHRSEVLMRKGALLFRAFGVPLAGACGAPGSSSGQNTDVPSQPLAKDAGADEGLVCGSSGTVTGDDRAVRACSIRRGWTPDNAELACQDNTDWELQNVHCKNDNC